MQCHFSLLASLEKYILHGRQFEALASCLDEFLPIVWGVSGGQPEALRLPAGRLPCVASSVSILASIQTSSSLGSEPEPVQACIPTRLPAIRDGCRTTQNPLSLSAFRVLKPPRFQPLRASSCWASHFIATGPGKQRQMMV